MSTAGSNRRRSHSRFEASTGPRIGKPARPSESIVPGPAGILPVAGHQAAVAYSRESPSPRYRELLALYKQMHLEGEPSLGLPAARTFAGGSLLRHAPDIKQLIDATGARTLLDYGSGKGQQYAARDIELPDGARIETLAQYWGGVHITSYDPAYEPLARLPVGRFDGVICTDVLEHCPEEDIPWIVDDLFSFARRFVFANIASFPAIKSLPNGENAHCTVRPPEWWAGLLHATAHRHPGLRYCVLVDSRFDRRAFLGRRRKPTYRTTVLDNRVSSPSDLPAAETSASMD
jgi:hypothetical protein